MWGSKVDEIIIGKTLQGLDMPSMPGDKNVWTDVWVQGNIQS